MTAYWRQRKGQTMSKGKLIKVCGECANYDWKKHRCKLGCNEGEPQEPFYTDCPLPTVNVGEWVSVDDRLPEASCECLVATAVGGVYLVNYSHRYKAFNATDELNGNKYAMHSVTHWMPLPSPPETKGGD